MVSTAQIDYPAKEEEGEECTEARESLEDENEDSCLKEDAVSLDEDNADDAKEDDGVPDNRSFSISPEDFCSDPYEQENHLEERQELGRRGEEAAVRYLVSKGYRILERNWYCRFGEADIIARDSDDTLCFIEVKTRRSVEAGIPEEAITRDKQKRYERIALSYMMACDDWDDNDSVRFDAIGICATQAHRALLRHHKGCFNGCF